MSESNNYHKLADEIASDILVAFIQSTPDCFKSSNDVAEAYGVIRDAVQVQKKKTGELPQPIAG